MVKELLRSIIGTALVMYGALRIKLHTRWTLRKKSQVLCLQLAQRDDSFPMRITLYRPWYYSVQPDVAAHEVLPHDGERNVGAYAMLRDGTVAYSPYIRDATGVIRPDDTYRPLGLLASWSRVFDAYRGVLRALG